MAATSQAWPNLEPEQQKLLLAALTSNKKRKSELDTAALSNNVVGGLATPDSITNGFASNGVNPAMLSSRTPTDFAAKMEQSPSFDLTSPDPTIDFDLTRSVNGFDDGFLGNANGQLNGEHGEKRKSLDYDQEDEDDDDNAEPEAKEAKKPGRKLITAEPTTKRKAQNRAAQRAFRERKEKHLKDLETKVTDLEKSSESANHENSVLRAQIERLQDEVKDYRKRLSYTNNSPTSARPSLDNGQSLSSSGFDFDFNFDIPRFGGVPGSVIPSTQAIQGSSVQQQQHQNSMSSNSFDDLTPTSLASHHNSVSSANGHHNSISSANGQQQQTTPNGGPHSAGSSMFGTGFFDVMGGVKKAQSPTPFGTILEDGKPTQSPPPFGNTLGGAPNSTYDRPSPGQTVSSASRSPCSNNGNGQSSSCCTSPEPTDWTQMYKGNKPSFNNAGSVDGNSYNSNTPGLTNAKTPNSDSFSLDFLANQNGGQFDPVLFGDYRDTQNAILGDDTFTGGFFEEGATFPDFSDPFNFNLSTDNTVPSAAPTNGLLKQLEQQYPVQRQDQQQQQQKKKPNLMEQVAQNQEGNYAGAPREGDLPVPTMEDYKAPNLMTCQKIWNQLQNCPRFQSGDFDVDSLCSELSAKAKCTNTGVAVPKEAVEAALWKLAGNPFQENNAPSPPQKQAQSPPAQTPTNSAKPDAKAEATRRFEAFLAKSGGYPNRN